MNKENDLDGTRTCDLWITVLVLNQLLYLALYTGSSQLSISWSLEHESEAIKTIHAV